MCDEVAERVTELERTTLTQQVVILVTATAVLLLILALRRKGILTTSLLGEAFPPAGAGA